jgi:Domain of unknown function (DUF397)
VLPKQQEIGPGGCILVRRSEQMSAVWVKSSLSFSNGNCVEVAELPGGVVGVRNSRDPDGPVLKFTPGEWDAFLGGARLGQFDRFCTAATRRLAEIPRPRHQAQAPLAAMPFQ